MRLLFVRLLAVLGTVLFAVLLLFTWWRPDVVERVLSERIRERIVERTAMRIEALAEKAGESRLGQLAQRTLGDQSARIEPLKQALKDRASAALGTVMVRMQNLDCECRDQAAGWLNQKLGLDLAFGTAAIGAIERFVYAQYHEVAGKLRQELRIVCWTHLAAFGLLLLASLRSAADTGARLWRPAVALLLATGACVLFFLKRQSWLKTLAFDDWLGWSYPVLLVLVFLAAMSVLQAGSGKPRA